MEWSGEEWNGNGMKWNWNGVYGNGMEPCNSSYIVPFYSIFYSLPILSTDVSKMHNNEAFLYFL